MNRTTSLFLPLATNALTSREKSNSIRAQKWLPGGVRQTARRPDSRGHTRSDHSPGSQPNAHQQARARRSITRPLRTSYRREKRASGTELPSGGAPKVAITSSVFGKRAVEPSIANRREPCHRRGVKPRSKPSSNTKDYRKLIHNYAVRQ